MKFAGDRESVLKKSYFNVWKEDWIECMAQKRSRFKSAQPNFSKDLRINFDVVHIVF